VEIIILPNYDQVSSEVSNRIISSIQKKPDIILGLATGKTMLGIYQKLIQSYNEKEVDFCKVKTFNLDEYIGPDSDDPITFHFYMKKNIFSKININPKNVFIPSIKPKNIELACRETPWDRKRRTHWIQ